MHLTTDNEDDLRKSSLCGEWLLPSLPVEHLAHFRAASTDIQLSGLM